MGEGTSARPRLQQEERFHIDLSAAENLPSDGLDHATSEIASGSKLGIDATRKIPGEGFKRPWPPLIRMSDEVRRKIDALFGNKSARRLSSSG
jgi:3-polyprenyl-4-hydroxybenzoate decarboxylase